MDRPDSSITSLHNPAIKRARSLLRRKGRFEERAFLVEGARAVLDLIAVDARPEVVYVSPDLDDEVRGLVFEAGWNIREVTTDVLRSISDVPEPQGIVAEVAMATISTISSNDVWSEPLIVVADGVRDPGNMGTLIRTAAGAGATLFLTTKQSVDVFNPKCVRAAMGGHFRLGIETVTGQDLASRLEGVDIIAITDAGATMDYDELDWKTPAAIVVGSEATGPGPEARHLATVSVRIPLARGLESLNAGVAGSHVVLEAARQRHAAMRSRTSR